jgi:hypothetical protein
MMPKPAQASRRNHAASHNQQTQPNQFRALHRQISKCFPRSQLAALRAHDKPRFIRKSRVSATRRAAASSDLIQPTQPFKAAVTHTYLFQQVYISTTAHSFRIRCTEYPRVTPSPQNSIANTESKST